MRHIRTVQPLVSGAARSVPNAATPCVPKVPCVPRATKIAGAVAVFAAAAVITAVLFVACVSSGNFENVKKSAACGDYQAALNRLEKNKDFLYAKQDRVLYNLDGGMLARFAGDYALSNEKLSKAEKLIDYYYAQSITQAVGSFMINDSLVDYAGEDYEDIYTNAFMALNYIQLGNTEDAFVEVRRIDNKIKRLSAKYQKAVEAARRQAGNEGFSEYPAQSGAFERHESTNKHPYAQKTDLQFYDSALARYISLLLYRSQGDLSNAEVDRKYIRTAFLTQKSLYPFAVPSAVDEELNVPQGKVRMNLLCFSGFAPEKTEEVIRVPNITGGPWLKIALPVMQKKPARVASVKAEVSASDGAKTSCRLELLESIENIAQDTFAQKSELIYLKTFLRALSKTAASTVAGAAAASQEDGSGNMSALSAFITLVSDIFIEVSERADVRCSHCFPAHVWAGGLNLDSGVYTVRVTCYDKNNRVVHEELKENVHIHSSSVNLVEAVCMR